MLEKTILTIEEPQVDFDVLCKAVRMDGEADPSDRAELGRMLAEALAVARPKALLQFFKALYIGDENGCAAHRHFQRICRCNANAIAGCAGHHFRALFGTGGNQL